MPTIAVANSKGGVGKTTICMLLASEISRQNAEVTIIDGDPNKHFAKWASQAMLPNVVESSQNTIINDIELAETKTSFVVIDLEGSANMTMAYAISKADIVIIPTQASDLDGGEVMNIADFVINQSKLLGRDIKKYVLFTKTSAAIITKLVKDLINDFTQAGLGIFRARLTERETFKKLFSNKCLLHQLIPSTKREIEAHNKALKLCSDLSLEIIEKIKEVV